MQSRIGSAQLVGDEFDRLVLKNGELWKRRDEDRIRVDSSVGSDLIQLGV